MRRLATLAAACLAAALTAAPAPAAALDEAAARGQLEEFLAAHIVEGYRTRDAELMLAAYAADADIVTYIAGRLDRDGFRERVGQDLARLGEVSPTLEFLELTFPGEAEALAQVRIAITGEDAGGQKIARGDRYWFLLRRGEAGWKIHRQGYRKDFSVGTGAHPKPAGSMHP